MKLDRRRNNDPTKAREARRLKREAALASPPPDAKPQQLALMDRRGRCRWGPFCPHPPGPGRFDGAFCDLHEQAAAYELDLIDELPKGAGWLPMSTDAEALIEDYEDAQEEIM